MSAIPKLYQSSLALLTDLYQLTMAYGYWKEGLAGWDAAFHLFFRKQPFQGGFTIAAGLEDAIEFIQQFRFSADDVEYLATLTGRDEKPLFDDGFLAALREFRFAGNVDAVPEGTVVFPHEPLVRVTAPLWHCQLLETPLLTITNFQTLIATKAARICLAAAGDAVIEFGLRRAQGIDGGITASRAAIVGGCQSTSNVLAGKLFGVPVKGTHAHSWVMSFDSEQASFEAYADAMPNNCIFLVDTYDTVEGVRRAAAVGKQMRDAGHEMVGIRLDSGDLTELSKRARQILDEEGFPEAVIVASSDLDEYKIAESKRRGGKITVWGVGTRLATAYDQPALGGVYKLGAIRKPGEPWQDKLKLSDEEAKVTNPGLQQVRRFFDENGAAADAIYNANETLEGECSIVSQRDSSQSRTMPAGSEFEDLLVPVIRDGRVVYDRPELMAIRERTLAQLARFPAGIKQLEDPQQYFVGLQRGMYERKVQLMKEVAPE